jgi:hypothetical protein
MVRNTRSNIQIDDAGDRPEPHLNLPFFLGRHRDNVLGLYVGATKSHLARHRRKEQSRHQQDGECTQKRLKRKKSGNRCYQLCKEVERHQFKFCASCEMLSTKESDPLGSLLAPI